MSALLFTIQCECQPGSDWEEQVWFAWISVRIVSEVMSSEGCLLLGVPMALQTQALQ